jgi:hypothetical protein
LLLREALKGKQDLIVLPLLGEEDTERPPVAVSLDLVDVASKMLRSRDPVRDDLMHRGCNLGGIGISQPVDELLDGPTAGGRPVVPPATPWSSPLALPSPRHQRTIARHQGRRARMSLTLETSNEQVNVAFGVVDTDVTHLRARGGLPRPRPRA